MSIVLGLLEFRASFVEEAVLLSRCHRRSALGCVILGLVCSWCGRIAGIGSRADGALRALSTNVNAWRAIQLLSAGLSMR